MQLSGIAMEKLISTPENLSLKEKHDKNLEAYL